MDHVQKESASLKSERDEATQKMSVCEARFDEFQVPFKNYRLDGIFTLAWSKTGTGTGTGTSIMQNISHCTWTRDREDH